MYVLWWVFCETETVTVFTNDDPLWYSTVKVTVIGCLYCLQLWAPPFFLLSIMQLIDFWQVPTMPLTFQSFLESYTQKLYCIFSVIIFVEKIFGFCHDSSTLFLHWTILLQHLRKLLLLRLLLHFDLHLSTNFCTWFIAFQKSLTTKTILATYNYIIWIYYCLWNIYALNLYLYIIYADHSRLVRMLGIFEIFDKFYCDLNFSQH